MQQTASPNPHSNTPALSLIGSHAGLAALGSEWRQLLEQCPQDNLFLSWEWVSTWYANFSDSCSLQVIVARAPDDGSLLGIAPLAIYPTRVASLITLRELGFVGRGLAPDHLDFPIRTGHERAVTAAFHDWIRTSAGRWDVLQLDGLSETSPLLQRLTGPPAPPWHHRHEIACPFLTLPGDRSAWLSGLPKKRRYKIRRGLQQLEEAFPGQIRLHRVESDTELPEAFKALVRLHRATRDARHTGNAFPDPRHLAFHRQICTLFLAQDRLRLYLLYAGGEVIAATYCFRYRDTVSFYSTGFAGRYRRFSPGMLLLAHAIGQSIVEGAAYFDFLRGDEPYKFIFARECRHDVHIRIPVSSIGRWTTRLYDLGRERVRPLFRALMPQTR